MNKKRLVFGLLVLSLTPILSHAEQKPSESYRVLFVNQRIELPPWVLSMFAQCREEFARLSGASVGMAIEKLESTDTGKWSEINNNSHLPALPTDVDFLVYRNPVTRPPLHLAAEAGVPLVIPACDTACMQPLEKIPPNVHIITITLSPIRTARLAERLCPNIHTLIVIGGSHPTDQFLMQRAREEMGDQCDGMAVEYWEGIMPAELQRRTAALPDDHAILFLKMARDPSGAIHNSRDVVRGLVACSPVPLFGISDVFLEEGCIGGYVVSSELEGHRAGRMLATLAAGKSLPALTHLADYGEYQFNWKALRRWGIRESRLPPGSRILYRPGNVLDRHPTLRRFLIGVMVTLLLVMGLLLIQRRGRFKTQKRLLASEQRLRLSTEMAGVAVWEYQVPENRLERSANHDALYGWDDQGECGLDTFLNAAVAGDREAMLERVRRITAPGGPDHFVIDFRVAWPDESLHWLSVSGEVVERDAAGAATLVRGCLQDISEQKQAAEALGDQKRRTDYILRGTNVGTWEWNVQTGETIFNERWAEMIGYTLDELAPVSIDTWIQLCHPDDLEESTRLLQECFSGEHAYYNCEARMRHKNGDWVWVLDRGKVGSWTDDGQPLWMYGTHQDITELKQSEAQLFASEASIRRKLKAITEPESDLGDLELSDIVNPETMQELLNEMHGITGMCVRIADLQGTILASVGWRDICSKFHRAHPDTAQNCAESDTLLASGVPPGEYKLYRCENQMWEAAAPISIAGAHLGNIFFGQFFFDDEEVDIEVFREQARRYGFDEADYLAALARVPRYSRATAEHAMRFFTQLADIISCQSHSNVKLSRTLAEREQAQKELRKSEERLREAQRTAHIAHWNFDPATGHSEWSEQMYTILGLDPAEGVPNFSEHMEFIHPDDWEGFEATVQDAVERATPYDIILRIQRPDGNVGFINAIGTPVADESGAVTELRGTIQDITARKQEQARLQMVNDALETSLNAFDIVNADGRFSYVNKAYVEMWGYDEAEEILGTSPIEHCLDPEQPGRMIHALRTRGEFEGEFTAKRKDGSTFDVLMVARRSADPDGNEIYTSSSIDITELKQARGALQKERDRLRLALDVVQMGAWDLNLIDHSSFRTPRHDQIFGYESPLEEWTYEMFLEHVLPEDREEVNRKFTAATANQSDWNFECRIRRADGEIRWISAVGRHDEPVDGVVRMMGGTVLDITERKRAEAELRQANDLLETRVAERTAELKARRDEAETLNRGMINLLQDLQTANRDLEQTEQALRATNKELESFSYSVSHDLRAPLRHIDGFVRLLLKREGGKLDETATRYLETISQSSDRMGHLIDDLLALSRTGRAAMNLRETDLNQLVHEVVDNLFSNTNDRDIEWNIAPLPSVVGDSSLLRQVWENLIGNAIKYTGKCANPRIEIGTRREQSGNEPEKTTFFIRDNGAGFDPHYSDKLFGVFQRLHREDEFEGTGIGLATVQRIVLRHGGRVWAEGKVNEGATFYFTLKGTE